MRWTSRLPLRRLLSASIRWRLAAWVAGVMLVSVAAIFIVVYNYTGSELRSQIDRDISDDSTQLAQGLRSTQAQNPADIAAAAGRYVHAQPFTASSTLLFVLVHGQSPVTNHPEVFGASKPDNGETVAEQDAENVLGHKLLTPVIGYSTRPVPDVGAVRIFEAPIQLAGTRVIVAAGEPLDAVKRAQNGVAKALVIAGLITLALALVASYLAGARVSAPLRRMAMVATRVNAGELEPRMELSAHQGDEIRVLAQAFNLMLDRLSEAFRGQRAFVADASHELRTPLTVIRGQLEVLAAEKDPPEEEVRRVERLVQAEISRISRLVDDLLLLAAAEQTDFLRLAPIDLPEFVEEIWDGVSLTAQRRFELSRVPAGTLDADPDRLAQALRNLARNAIEHTAPETGLVRLDVDREGADQIRFTAIDDGPGIPPEDRERVFERLYRTDSSRTRTAGGAGLGLAIVRAIAEAHGGRVRARDPDDGTGARVELVLGGFHPA
jgi:two-component system OmpR family sensor kinase